MSVVHVLSLNSAILQCQKPGFHSIGPITSNLNSQVSSFSEEVLREKLYKTKNP